MRQESYEAPTATVLGSIEELTAGAAGNPTDGAKASVGSVLPG